MDQKAFAALLDKWQDGTLDAEEEAMLLEHISACPEDAPVLEAARAYRRVMDGFVKDPDVPLIAQAAWHRAIREEKKRAFRRRVTRLVAAAAAVCLMMVGVLSTIRMNGGPSVRRVETDGLESVGESAVTPASAYEEVSVSVDSIEDAAQPLEDIIAEYAGAVDFTESGEMQERVYVSFDQADEDFLEALGGLGDVDGTAQAGENICVILTEK